jgi:hypothetical protein
MNDTIQRPIPDSYWVMPGLFLAGEYPGSHDLADTRRRMDAFLAAGIDDFIDLTQAGELQPYEQILLEQVRRRGLRAAYTRLSIRDHDVPAPQAMAAILDRIDRSLAEGRRPYLHCWGGIGRTGTAVGCHLVRRGLTGPQALEQLAAWWAAVPKQAWHPRSPETDEQVRFVLNWKEPPAPG